jgi:hypothetical protein
LPEKTLNLEGRQIVVGSAREALEAIAKTKPDLLLSVGKIK